MPYPLEVWFAVLKRGNFYQNLKILFKTSKTDIYQALKMFLLLLLF